MIRMVFDVWFQIGAMRVLGEWLEANHSYCRKPSPLITNGSSRGATLGFTLRSKGEGGQPRCLIIQEIVYILRHARRTLQADPKHCNLHCFCDFCMENHVLQHDENCVNTSVFARCCPKKQCKYSGFCMFLPPGTENIVACEAPKASKFTVLFAPNAFRNWLNTAKMAPRGALRASPPSSTSVTTASDFAVVTHFAPMCFYKQTTLRTEAFTQSGFCAQILLYKEVCAQSFYIQTPLHTETFMQRHFYTSVLTHRCLAQRCWSTQALLHTHLLHRSLCTEQLLHKEAVTQKNFDTEKLLHTDCAKKLLHTETFITRRNVSAQKPLRTAVFAHRRFYTQMLLHRKTFNHRNLCTQHAFTQRGFASPSWSPTFRVPLSSTVSVDRLLGKPLRDSNKTGRWTCTGPFALQKSCIDDCVSL